MMFCGCESEVAPVVPQQYVADMEVWLEPPLGLDVEIFYNPPNNPISSDKVALGRLLFFDKRLSVDNSISCAFCHSPETGFSNNARTAVGVNGGQGTRNVPTILNRVADAPQYWDGRARSLEEQALGPMIHPLEMGMADAAAVTEKIANIRGYADLFDQVFGGPVNVTDMTKAISAFERTIVSGNSRWDQFMNGDAKALTAPEQRGRALFASKGRCNQCHSGWNLTDEKFHNIGIGWDALDPDLGRFVVSGAERDKGAFKTPTLREITLTAPYMHDGRFRTLEQVVEYYSGGVISNPFLDPEMRRPALSLEQTLDIYDLSKGAPVNTTLPVKELDLSEQEIGDLVAFLQALNGEGWQTIRAPDSFPE
jgi:cytochrome c peroxidase